MEIRRSAAHGPCIPFGVDGRHALAPIGNFDWSASPNTMATAKQPCGNFGSYG